MRLAPQDELLLCGEDGVGIHRTIPHLGKFAVETGFFGQRIDQPRLPLGLRPDRRQRIVCKHLPRLLGMLP